jgi:hypothetical protein
MNANALTALDATCSPPEPAALFYLRKNTVTVALLSLLGVDIGTERSRKLTVRGGENPGTLISFGSAVAVRRLPLYLAA